MKQLFFVFAFGLFSQTVFSQLVISSSIVTDPLCAGDCNGSIQVTVSGGTAPYTYVWQDDLGTIIGGNSPTITNLCAGNYTVTVADASIGGGGITTVYSEDFETGGTSWSLNNPVGVQGTDPNFFVINDNEGGAAPGGCGVAGNGDETLHITSVFNATGGAAYDAGGLCGILFCPETHVRAESGPISTVGFSNLSLSFEYIANGDQPNDQATVWINSGTGWIQLGTPLNTALCPTGQGLWTAYATLLPASCNNIPNLQIGIQWDNNDDGVGSDPSVSINNILISAPTPGGGNPPISQTFTLTSPTAPSIDAGADVTICAGTDVTLTATIGSPNPGTISWDNGVVQNIPFTPSATTTYTATVTETGSGCTATDQVTVTVEDLPQVEIVADARFGCSPLTVNFVSNTTNSIGCDWTFSDGQFYTGCGSRTVVFDDLGCVDLNITATSLNGCVATINYPSIVCVTGGPVAAFTASPATLNPETPITALSNASTGATNYVWDFGDGTTSTSTSPVHEYAVGASGVYTVVLTATDDGGCEDQATAVITIDEELLYYIPNTFTPNDNEYNQLFLPVFTSGFDIYDYSFTVFNRWGDQLFESKDHLVGWDGSIKGNSPLEGTYIWRIEFRRSESDERILVTGHVNLLK